MQNFFTRYGFATTLVAVLGLFVTSCTDLELENDDFVELENTGGVLVPGDPDAIVDGIYADMGVFGDQANFYSLFQHTSDEMIPPTRGVDWGDNGVWRTLHQHTWDPTHQQVNNAYNTTNRFVFRTVEALAASGLSDETRAQAEFLQGYFLWHVLDLFGSVPFREFDEGVDVLPRVLSRTEAFNRAVDLVTGSIDNLPSQGPGDNERATKAAAYLLLTRMHLNAAVYNADNPAGPYEFSNDNLQEVVRYADLLEEEGYSLVDDYFSIWEAGANSEEILVTTRNNGSNRWNMTLHYSQNPSGWNGFTTLAEFYDTFDEEDDRIGMEATPDGSEFSAIGTGFLIGQQFTDDGEILNDSRTNRPLQFTREVPLNRAPTAAGIRVIKYHPARSDSYVILRYGEAVLNKAEAMLRMGNTQEALDLINELRAARGASEYSSIDLDELLAERGRETYWEALRRIDQIRFGTFNNTWDEKTVTEDFRVLFPIPQQALSTNPNLTQNPGY